MYEVKRTATPANRQKTGISAFVVCCNEERNIRRCLESVNWCDELIVIDSGSTDKTLEICKEYGALIFHRAWTGYVDQKRFGLSKCSSPWILNIDADEEISPELRDEIITLSQSDKFQSPNVRGFYISRVVFYLGRWWRHGGWYPEYRLRLCHRESTQWAGIDPHEKAVVDGPAERLNGEMRHYTYTGITDQINRINRYSLTSAENMFKNGERTSIVQIFMNPLIRFVKFYVLKKGFMEGVPGLFVAFIEAFSTYLKYLKLWELQRNNSMNQIDPGQSD